VGKPGLTKGEPHALRRKLPLRRRHIQHRRRRAHRSHYCNCSHCSRKGLVLTFVPAAQFTLESGADTLESYEFHKHRIEHQFCKTCGTQPFAASAMPDGTAMRAINLRCVPSVDIDTLAFRQVDGARF
jgi:hypothetical protein